MKRLGTVPFSNTKTSLNTKRNHNHRYNAERIKKDAITGKERLLYIPRSKPIPPPTITRRIAIITLAPTVHFAPSIISWKRSRPFSSLPNQNLFDGENGAASSSPFRYTSS